MSSETPSLDQVAPFLCIGGNWYLDAEQIIEIHPASDDPEVTEIETASGTTHRVRQPVHEVAVRVADTRNATARKRAGQLAHTLASVRNRNREVARSLPRKPNARRSVSVPARADLRLARARARRTPPSAIRAGE